MKLVTLRDREWLLLVGGIPTFLELLSKKLEIRMDKSVIYRIMGASNHTQDARAEQDFYATDPKAIDLLLEREEFSPSILEPACGMGHLSERLEQHYYLTHSSDIVDRGYGVVQDFFSYAEWYGDIITNPPYSLAQEFIEHALNITTSLYIIGGEEMYSWRYEHIEIRLLTFIFDKMTREEKIQAIYKEMANKELTFGCKLQVIESVGPIQGVIFNIVSESYKVLWDDRRISTETKNNDFSVIGHPVMIGDVIDWIHPYGTGCAQDVRFTEERRRKVNLILFQWDKKREPIEAQSDECIDYVYSLIQKD